MARWRSKDTEVSAAGARSAANSSRPDFCAGAGLALPNGALRSWKPPSAKKVATRKIKPIARRDISGPRGINKVEHRSYRLYLVAGKGTSQADNGTVVTKKLPPIKLELIIERHGVSGTYTIS